MLAASVNALLPFSPELGTDMIKWADNKIWVRLLGIPFWETHVADTFNDFFDNLYLNPSSSVVHLADDPPSR